MPLQTLFPLASAELEHQRLEDLRSFDMLQTPSEEPFDGIVEIAAALFGVPVALVTLMDAETQWFKAKVGTPLATNARHESFCHVTIQRQATLVVPDATLDARFANLPCVAKMGIRFYAGTPLISDRGQAVGTVCVLDVAPREFGATECRLLERLARQATEAMESRRLVQSLLDQLIDAQRAGVRRIATG